MRQLSKGDVELDKLNKYILIFSNVWLVCILIAFVKGYKNIVFPCIIYIVLITIHTAVDTYIAIKKNKDSLYKE